MKIAIPVKTETPSTLMRKVGYVPDGTDERTGELRFFRSLAGRRYPRFHVYATFTNDQALLNLHLDQKAPVYQGVSAHSGEYEGTLIEQEAKRIVSQLS
jgi:hypothetical protein